MKRHHHFYLGILLALAGTLPTPAWVRAAEDAEATAATATLDEAQGDASSEASPASDDAASNGAAMPPIELKYQDGTIVLPDNLATIKLPPSLRFLDGEQTRFVLESLWGNPDGQGHLGMIVPAETGPLGEKGWGVVISYDDSGHISDDEASTINYDDLLKQMRSNEQDVNERRKSAGYEPVYLVGWAKPPHYDQADKKLHWAKELKFGDAQEAPHVLNYAIRVLGRRGYLELNAVADMAQIQDIEAAIPGVLGAVDFNDGQRYADFDPSTDKVAEYGIAALVLGGVAAKTGLLKGLFAMLLAAKKLIIVGVLAVGGFLSKLFKGGSSSQAKS